MSYNNNNNNDDENQLKKLFIGGLNIETTNDSLKAFYSNWGEVADCKVVMDANTGRSKCYAFLTFAETEALDRCMLDRPHVVDGKQVDPKRAMPRKEVQNIEANQRVKKIFIGGLRDLVESEIREYFSKFGKVVAFDMVTDKATGKTRGFAFLTYDDTDSVDKTVLLKYHTIRDIRVEVKKAVEKDGRRGTGGPMQGRGGMGRQGMHSNNVPMPQLGAYGGHYAMTPDMQAQWSMSQMWNQWYGGLEAGIGYPLGSDYGNAQGGGAARGNRHAQRAAGPYENSNVGAYGNVNTNASYPYAVANAYSTQGSSAPLHGSNATAYGTNNVAQPYGSNASVAGGYAQK